MSEDDCLESRIFPQAWLGRAAAAVILVGVVWRLVRYAGLFPIWGDEAMLLLNILDRDYAGLTEQLRFCQVAPLLFLWAERTALLVFGSGEWSVHLFPLLMGLAALAFFWQACRTSFPPMTANLAVAVLAVSYYPVRHACEVKPYAFDLCIAAAYFWAGTAATRHCMDRPLTPSHSPPEGRGEWPLSALVCLTPIAVFSSYPSVFVGGAISLVLLPSILRSGAPSMRAALYVLFNAVLAGSFVIHYTQVGQHGADAAEAARAREFLHNYWREAFPPDSLLDWPLWLLEAFTGRMFAYPLGANHGGSIVTFLLVALGSVALWRGNRRQLLALCWAPFALNLLAAILGKYPFGGSARIMQHLAPFICVLMAHGAAQAIGWIRASSARFRIELGLYALLFACGIVGIARDLAKPYKTDHDREVRAVVRELAGQVGVGEIVVLCNAGDKGTLAEMQWYLRTAPFEARWLLTFDPSSADSCWLFMCSQQESSVPDALAVAGSRFTGWRPMESQSRVVPPENTKMQTVHCRWVRCVKEPRTE